MRAVHPANFLQILQSGPPILAHDDTLVMISLLDINTSTYYVVAIDPGKLDTKPVDDTNR